MRKRQIKFILALTSLSFLIWMIGEGLIAWLINNYYISLGWGIFCFIACCGYSVWKCPHELDEDENEDEET
ncbi:MAG: hypothetical protein V3G42_02385 [Oscillospiraceae bacterium]